MRKVVLLIAIFFAQLIEAQSVHAKYGTYKSELDSLGAKALADCGCHYATKGAGGLEKIRNRLSTKTIEGEYYSRDAREACYNCKLDISLKHNGELNPAKNSIVIENLKKSLFITCFPEMEKKRSDEIYSKITLSSSYKHNPDIVMRIMLKIFARELKCPDGISDYNEGSILLNTMDKRLYELANYLTDIESLDIDPIFKLELEDVLIAGEDKEYLRDMLCGQLKDGFTDYKEDIEKVLIQFYGSAKCKSPNQKSN